MIRRYEDPRKVQELLNEAERRLSDAQARGDEIENVIDLHNEVEELRERLNFAWQDDEFDADCEQYGY